MGNPETKVALGYDIVQRKSNERQLQDEHGPHRKKRDWVRCWQILEITGASPSIFLPYAFHKPLLVNNAAINIYTHDYITMEITVLYLKISRHQLEIWWWQIEFTGDALAIIKSPIDAVKFSNTIQLSPNFIIFRLPRPVLNQWSTVPEACMLNNNWQIISLSDSLVNLPLGIGDLSLLWLFY